MTKQLERLKIIYTYLKITSADLKTILEHLKQKDAQISDRQLQRDLIDVKSFFLTANEKLVITKEGLKKTYKISSSNKIMAYSQETINTWQLIEQSGTVPLLNERGKDPKAMHKILSRVITLASGKQNLNSSEIIKSTNFYTVKKDDNFNKVVDHLLKAIRESVYVKIDRIIQDFTGTGINMGRDKLNVKFAPVGIVYHRGDFFIQGIENKKVVVYEVGQFQNIKLLQDGFNHDKCKETVKSELEKRFGITENINNEVYDITLEFSSITGALVSKYHWHSTQKFKKENNSWKMTMKCGINRELLGWIFQWMYNVRIIEPVILQDYYNETLRKITENGKSEKHLVYTNIFEPT
jgi:hypothetical protein